MLTLLKIRSNHDYFTYNLETFMHNHKFLTSPHQNPHIPSLQPPPNPYKPQKEAARDSILTIFLTFYSPHQNPHLTQNTIANADVVIDF